MNETARFPLPWKLLAAALLVALGGAATIAILRGDVPLLTAAEFSAAEARWKALDLPDYTIVVRKQLDRAPAERLETVVTGGEAQRLRIDGQEVPVRASYTIPGLFDIIARELEMARDETTRPGLPQGATLRARFDSATGLPVSFRRLAPEGKSVFLDVERLEVPGEGQVYPRQEGK